MQLTKFLNTSFIVNSVFPAVGHLVPFLSKIKQQNKPVQLFYGETYDEFGITIDSLKYYFILSLLHKTLEKRGLLVSSTIIEADVASLLNPSAQSKRKKLEQQKTNRLKLINKILKTYHLPSKVRLMSDIFKTSAFKQKLEVVSNFTQGQSLKSSYFQNLKKTVLKNRLAQEQKTNFRYAREAIATSMLFDIKLGPMRERFYDQAQHILANNLNLPLLKSVYLSPTYPLGQNFTYFLNHPETEKYGLTPYKASSNKLQKYRIILAETKFEQIKNLINDSFESDNKTAHPVLDLYLIAIMAKRFLQKNFDLFAVNKDELLGDIVKLKQQTLTLINDAILRRLDYD